MSEFIKDYSRQGAAERPNACRVSLFTVTLLSVAAWLLSFSTATFADSSALFGYVGRLKVINDTSYVYTAASQYPGMAYCCSLCIVDALCAGINYDEGSRHCKLLRLAKWQLVSDDGYQLLVRGYFQGGSQQFGNFSVALWLITRQITPPGGQYRMFPGAYPTLQNFLLQRTGNVIDSSHCRQLCENQFLSCSLFAYNFKQSQCDIIIGDVQPQFLSFGMNNTNWTSYYYFNNDFHECSTAYYLVSKSMSFDSADQHCHNAYGARLAAVNSAEEQAFLLRVINASKDFKQQDFWIGGISAHYPYDFRWTCRGTNVSFSHWAPGEPNSQSELCIHMRPDYTWNNDACETNKFFICEDCLLDGC